MITEELQPRFYICQLLELQIIFQVQEWIGTETHLQPIDWGRTIANKRLVVVENRFAPGIMFMQTDL